MNGNHCSNKAYYKIGELARLSQLSPRTIDYYTSIGLIQPEKRSETNYRLYNDETLTRLKRIEMMKKEKYTLEEIRERLEQWSSITNDQLVTQKLTSLQLHMQQLHKEVMELKPVIEQLKPSQAKNLFKHLTPQSAACIEALIILLGKGPVG